MQWPLARTGAGFPVPGWLRAYGLRQHVFAGIAAAAVVVPIALVRGEYDQRMRARGRLMSTKAGPR